MVTLVIYAALVNWFVTYIFTEGKIFSPLRTWIIHEAYHITHNGERHKIGNKHWYTFPEETTQEEADAAKPYLWGRWAWAASLVTCAACTRVWVGFAEAAYFGGPDRHWASLIANGLLYAAAGHLIFEARSRVALVTPTEAP